MKRGVLILRFIFLFPINFISAQFGSGYGSFSLQNFLDTLDPTAVTYVLLFLIIFTLIHLALSKVSLFKSSRRNQWGGTEITHNKAASGIISFALASMVVFYLYKSGYNFESFLFDLGIQGDLLSMVLVVAFAALTIYVVTRFGFKGFFTISGLLIIFISIFTELIYEKIIAFFIGLALLVVGLYLWNKARINHWTERNLVSN